MDCVFRTSSDLSVKSGTIFVDKIPQIAKEKGFNAVGITDFMNLFGFIKFYKSCLKNEVKPIIGVEILLINEKSEKYKILIYAKNYTGLREIFKIISDAYISEREADSDVAIEEKYFFDNYNFENIIIFSGGVFGFASLSKNINDFENYLLKYKNKFKDDFYIEINRFQSKLYNINDILLNSYNLSKKLDIKLINSQPIFFEKKEDFLAHSIRVSAIKNEKLNKSNLNKIDGDYTYDMYFKSKKEIDDLFFDLKDCLNTTETEILNKINIEIKLGFNDLPIYKTPNNESIEVFFRNKSYEGLENRMRTYFSDKEYLENKESYIKRLDYEIDTIINMKFVGYFLIVADFINWAKNNDIPVGPGRGSGAGSLVAYSLGITDLNPIPYDLLFERFLNPERVSMPDFDIDFCQEKRDLVIQYVQEKYGKEAVAQIMTNGTMASRSVIKDVARVLGLPYVLADNITQKINMTQSLEEAYNEELPENLGLQKMIDRDEVGTEIWDNALKLEGVTKSIGKHAAGILIAPNKIIDYSPLYHSDGLPVSQLDKNDVEEAGLVKFDFLGLRNLTIIHYCLKMIKKVRNINFKIESNFNDDKTYKLLENANTTAVFQLESFGMKKYLKKMKPDCFEDIIAILALYRPGPLGSGMVDSFIKRKNWEKSGKPPKETTLNFDLNYEVSDYFTQALEECLKPTYGIIVYQEQVMKISQIIAGYSLGGADLLRRCVSGDSMIYVDKIGNIKVSELYNNYKNKYSNLCLSTLNEATQKIELDKINDVFYSGQKETFKVIFKSGREINITKDHPILTFDGWKSLENIDLKNDFIALTTKIHTNYDNNIIDNYSNEEIKIVAYLIGDGYINKNKMNCSYFCNTDLGKINDFVEACKKFFGIELKIRTQYKSNLKNVYYVNLNKTIQDWLLKNVKCETSEFKEIPEFCFNLNKEKLKLFIGTLWNTDGSFDRTIGHCDYNSKSKKLIMQLNTLLLKLGIFAKLEVKNIKYNNSKFYRSQITGKKDFLLFFNQISKYLSADKLSFANDCFNKISKKGITTSKYNIPFQVLKKIIQKKNQTGKSWNELNLKNLIGGINFSNPKRCLTRPKLLKFANKLDCLELQTIANSDILWDQIKSIESNGIEMVYDISMCKNHNFIINDVIVHNCMGKKKPEEMAKQRGIFNEGALKNGYSLELATHLFDLMEKFAEYGFNKSHSAAYAVITYQTAFLKAHYPIEFMAATLMSEEHDTEKINILIEDCKFNNIKVNNPDINDSEIHFTPTLSEIKYSLSALKGIGIDIAKEIVKERKENGLYTSFENFCSRNVKILNKKSLSSLIRSGCFDKFSNNRAKYFFSIDDVLKQKQKILSQRLESVSLFEEYNNEKIYLSPDYDKHNWTIIEKIENEILGIGFELTTNLYVKYKEKIESLDDGSISPSYFENKNNLFILMSNQHMKKNEFILYGVIKDHIDNSSPQLIIKDDSSFIKCSIVYSLVRGKYKLIKESLLNNRFIKCKISVYIKKDENNEDNEYKLFFNITEIYDVFD